LLRRQDEDGMPAYEERPTWAVDFDADRSNRVQRRYGWYVGWIALTAS